MSRRPPRSTRTVTLFPYTALFRSGRFWIGSGTSDKANPAATLYRLDPDGSLRAIFGGLLTSNGAAFSPDGRTFYHADTPTHALRAYDVDPATGALGAGPLFHQFEHGSGRPEGGAVDAEGCYWSALRSEERRGGKECVSTCNSRCWLVP